MRCHLAVLPALALFTACALPPPQPAMTPAVHMVAEEQATRRSSCGPVLTRRTSPPMTEALSLIPSIPIVLTGPLSRNLTPRQNPQRLFRPSGFSPSLSDGCCRADPLRSESVSEP
jgi:hypothetical protein